MTNQRPIRRPLICLSLFSSQLTTIYKFSHVFYYFLLPNLSLYYAPSVGGQTWWMSKESGDSTPTIIEGDIMIPEPSSSPSSVEMCSYALLTYLHMSDINKAKPVAMWLTKQRGASGGYHGTQV